MANRTLFSSVFLAFLKDLLPYVTRRGSVWLSGMQTRTRVSGFEPVTVWSPVVWWSAILFRHTRGTFLNVSALGIFQLTAVPLRAVLPTVSYSVIVWRIVWRLICILLSLLSSPPSSSSSSSHIQTWLTSGKYLDAVPLCSLRTPRDVLRPSKRVE